MDIVNTISLDSNKQIKINFKGGDLSSDAGALLLKEFICRAGLQKVIKSIFKTSAPTKKRIHSDDDNLWQVIYQVICGYFEDNSADELSNDPVLTAVLGKKRLASQPTLSRFFNRMDERTLDQFYRLARELRKVVYAIEYRKTVVLDLDSTLLDTYGSQEGEGFNFHYQNHGYHPLVCYDGISGDLLKIELRRGTAYSCTGVTEFLQPVLDEFLTDHPDTALVLRGDSGFATPGLYQQCETNGTSYAIRLKENRTLRRLAEYEEKLLYKKTLKNQVDYAVIYGEFEYQAGSWDYPRRVVFKIEKPYGQMVHMHTFIVTNMDASPADVIHFYCKRGTMENFIKESKNGFDFRSVSSHSMITNACRVQVRALAYNIFNWFKRLVLPKYLRKCTVDTIRMKLLKIAAKAVHSARYTIFKLCSSCPYKNEFYETLENIHRLRPQRE